MTGPSISPLEKISAAIISKQERENKARLKQKEQEEKHAEAMLVRQEFLESVQAIPAPASLYALWLHTFLQQPGTNIHQVSSAQYPTPRAESGETITVRSLASLGSSGPTFETIETSHYDDPFVMWLATKDSPLQIPEAYGATSMNLMHLPDFSDLNTSSSSRNGRREGWEYGHTALFTLKLANDDTDTLIATTNQPDMVTTYPDINDILAGLSDEGDLESAAASIRTMATRRKIAMTAIEDQRQAEQADKNERGPKSIDS